MGALVAITGKNNYEEGKYKFYVVPSAVSFVVMILETVMLKNLEMGYGNLTTQLFLPITSYYLFNLILSIKLKDRPIYSNFREMSILLYLSHCFIIRSINMLYAILGHTKGSGINLFMETLVVATAFSYMVMKLSKNKMKWLKVLY